MGIANYIPPCISVRDLGPRGDATTSQLSIDPHTPAPTHRRRAVCFQQTFFQLQV